MDTTKQMSELYKLGVMSDIKTIDDWVNYITLSETEAPFETTEEEQQCMKIMWKTDSAGFYKNIQLVDLVRMPFNSAKKCIDNVDMATRLKLLEELHTTRSYLYTQTNRYGDGVPKDEALSSAMFMSIMGKIKHLEIIQNWLYGIE